METPIHRPIFLFLNWRDWTHPKAGGSEEYLRVITTGLAELGYVVKLVVQRYPGSSGIEELGGVVVIRAGNQISGYVRALGVLKRETIRSPTRIIVESVNTLPFLARLLGDRQIVLIPHLAASELFSEAPFPLSIILFGMERIGPLLFHNRIVITISQQSKEEMVRVGHRSQNVRIVSPGVDSRMFRTSEPSQSPAQKLCYIGPLKSYKGVMEALEGFKLLLREFPQAEFHVAGRGYLERSLKQRVSKDGLARSVILHGYISEEEKVALLRECSVFVTLSSSEGGWSIAVLEAMAAGLPIVVSPATSEMAAEGRGTIVNPSNPEEVARAVSRYWSDTASWVEASRKAREWALGYSNKRTVQEFYEVVTGLSAAPHSAEGPRTAGRT